METAPLQAETVAPRPALPLLALLALASVLGVAVAIVLAGITMLLAAPAYGAESEGRLLLERQGRLVEATLLHIETERTGIRTRIMATFQNPFGERLIARYIHRLPPGAIVEKLAVLGAGEDDDEAEDSPEARPAVLVLGAESGLAEHATEIGPGEILVIELEYRQRRPLLALR